MKAVLSGHTICASQQIRVKAQHNQHSLLQQFLKISTFCLNLAINTIAVYRWKLTRIQRTSSACAESSV